MTPLRCFSACLVVLAAWSGSAAAIASARSAADECHPHIASAEAARGIPSGLLAAIGSVESGMDPLAINADGVSYRGRTAAEAAALVRALQRSGARYVDVGCLQIDLFFHPAAFVSIEQAFDPAANVAYGAWLLANNHAQSGDWGTAVASYHSRQPARRAAYLRRVAAKYGPLSDRLSSGLTLQAGDAGTRMAARPITIRLSFMTITRPAAVAQR